jgi:HD-GYP domain-containing protein (c-di-GMP phosphodiesterase class II)
MRDVSLRARVAAVVALAAIACAGVMGVVGMGITRTRLEEVAGGAAEDVAILLAEDLVSEGLTPDRIAADPSLQRRASEQLGQQLRRLNGAESLWTNVAVLKPEQDAWLVLVRADESESDRLTTVPGQTIRIRDEVPRKAPSLDEPVRGRFLTDLNEWFGAAVPLGAEAGDGKATGVLVLTMHIDEAEAYVNEVRQSMLLGLAGAAIVGLGLGWWCAAVILRPIEVVRAFAARLGRRELGTRVEVRGAPEMRRLLGDMNTLADDLSRSELRLHERTVRMAEMRDPKETGPHVKRVSGVSVEIFEGWLARHPMGAQEAAVARETLRAAAVLHDVGKVAIEDAVLKKPGKLDEAEYDNMKHHSVIGGLVLAGDDARDRAARDVALHHHERWDGKGYPGRADVASAQGDLARLRQLPLPSAGLAGTEIPLFARIVAIADVFDALSSRRSYKDPWSEERVLQFIREEAGKAFDPELVEIFIERFGQVKAAWARHPDHGA